MKRLLGRLAYNSAGNFAILGAFLAVPLALASAVAIDVTTIVQKKTELQDYLDGAALAIAREGQQTTASQGYEIARLYLMQWPSGASIKYEVVKNGTSFTVAGSMPAKMAFAGLIGYGERPVKAAATADIAYTSYEIGLILDTTGSMKGGKIQAMKDAVAGLIDTMSKQVDDKDKLKFAVVPFASFVNVGARFGPSFDKKGKQIDGTGAEWLDLKGASEIPQVELAKGASRFQVYNNLDQTWPGCVESRTAAGKDYDTTDAAANPAEPATLFVPAFSIDEPDTTQFVNSYIKSNVDPTDPRVGKKKQKLAKYGIATDSAGNPLLGGLLSDVLGLLGIGVTPPKIAIDTSPSRLFGNPKGPGLGCEVQPIVALTNDYKALTDKVNSLKANGYTNILEGVAWGWRVLSPSAPFAEGSPKGTQNLRRIMIVLTDGSNVFGVASNSLGSTYSSYGYAYDERLLSGPATVGSTANAMNDKTLAACKNAKADGMEIYTIRLEEPNVATGTMLRECASSPDKYFDVPSRSQLDKAFEGIKTSITTVRLSS